MLEQVWFQNRRAKWRKNSERLQRSFSDIALESGSARPERTDTAEIGFWLAESYSASLPHSLAENSLISSLLSARSASARCEHSVCKRSAAPCRMNFNNNAERDKLTLAEDLASLRRVSPTLNNASDYRTNGLYRTPNANPSQFVR